MLYAFNINDTNPEYQMLGVRYKTPFTVAGTSFIGMQVGIFKRRSRYVSERRCVSNSETGILR